MVIKLGHREVNLKKEEDLKVLDKKELMKVKILKIWLFMVLIIYEIEVVVVKQGHNQKVIIDLYHVNK